MRARIACSKGQVRSEEAATEVVRARRTAESSGVVRIVRLWRRWCRSWRCGIEAQGKRRGRRRMRSSTRVDAMR